MQAVLLFEPKHRLDHPGKYLFVLLKKYIYRIKVSQIILLQFEKNRNIVSLSQNHRMQILIAWRNFTRFQASTKECLDTFTPEIEAALSADPGNRSRPEINTILALVSTFPFAKHLPPSSLLKCCRHMTYEILSSSMVSCRASVLKIK